MRAALTRERIVDAAWHLLHAEGFEAVSLRRIAASLDVTAPALYAHIDGKEDLLEAVAEREFDELESRIAPNGTTDPASAVEAFVAAYVRFAIERPNAFRLLFRLDVDLDDPEATLTRHGRIAGLFARSKGLIEDAVSDGSFRPADAAVIAFGLWSTAHGIATGIQLGYESPDVDALVSGVVAGFVEGLRAI